MPKKISKIERLGYLLAADFKLFCRHFFKAVFNSEFQQRPHVSIIQDELLKVFEGKITYLNINVHPGSFKSTLLIFFIAWCIAREPRATFIYITYSFSLAVDKTTNIFRILNNPQYKELFGVEIDPYEFSKSRFKTTAGGGVLAAGSQGTITGFDAGKPDEDTLGQNPPFLGAIVIDDSLKGSDAFSTAAREKIKTTYFETILTRRRGTRVPVISIAQRLHEDDLASVFLKKEDGKDWHNLVLPFLKEDGEVLDPLIMPKGEFLTLLNNPKTAYAASSQYMQNPIPLGDVLFEESDFKILDVIPPLETIFITGDLAETDNRANDATAFSAWGIFEIKYNGKPSGQKALLWLDCIEVWVKPSEIMSTFMDFYANIERTYSKVNEIRIENKSMGVMLNSFLYSQPGVTCIPLIRGNKMSKMDRILQSQTKTRGGLICLPKRGKHNRLVIEHLQKITKIGSNLLDDIADTMADAVSLVFFENLVGKRRENEDFKSAFSLLQGKGLGNSKVRR